MNNLYVENRLINIQLPEILTIVITRINNIAIPALNELIEQLESNQNNSILLNLVSFLIILVILKSVMGNLFTFNAPQIKQCSQQQIDSQLKQLNQEIGNLKNSLKKVIEKINLGDSGDKKASFQKKDLVKLMDSYKKTVDDFNSLANFVIDSQQNVYQELKSFKKHQQKASRVSSIPSKEIEVNNHQQTNSSETQQTIEETKIVSTKAAQPRRIKPPTPARRNNPAPIPAN